MVSALSNMFGKYTLMLVISVLSARISGGAENSWSSSSQWSFSGNWPPGKQQGNSQNAPIFNHDQLLSLISNSDRPTFNSNHRPVRQPQLLQALAQHVNNQNRPFDGRLEHVNNQFQQLNSQVLEFTNQLLQFGNRSPNPDNRGQNQIRPPPNQVQQLDSSNNNQGQRFDNQGQRFDNQGQQFDNQGQRFDNQGKQFENQGQRFDNQGQRFDNQGQRFDNQGKQFDNQGQRFDNQGQRFDNQGKQFDNQGQQFDNQGQRFDNQGQRFDNQGQRFDNQGKQFDNQGQQFDSQGQRFDNQGQRFDNQGKQFDNQGQRFDNQGQRFNNQGKQFDNQGQRFDNQGQRFDNQGKQFENQGQRFDKQGQRFDNQGKQFDNQGERFNNQGQQFDNQGQRFDNQGKQFDNQGQQLDLRGSQFDKKEPQIKNQEPQFNNEEPQFNIQESQFDSKESNSELPQSDNRDPQSTNQRRQVQRPREQPTNQRQSFSRVPEEVDDRPVWGGHGGAGENKNIADPKFKSKLTTSSGEEEQPQANPASIGDEEGDLYVPPSMREFVKTRSMKHCLSYCRYPAGGVGFASGGQNARLHEFPHMAALGFGSGSFQGRSLVAWNNCGGTLISKDYVLTAAHCLDSDMGPPTQVRIGEHDLSRRDESASLPQDYPILRIVVHPGYEPKKSLYNDIALLQLVGSVNFTQHMRPACLHNGNVVRDENMRAIKEPTAGVATGWGNTGFVDAPSDILQKVDLDIIDTPTCQRYVKADQFIPSGVQGDSQVCAGVLAGGRDTCQGDSGGPLQVNHTVFDPIRECPMEIVGITSFGKICSEANSPGVYTRVAHYVPWIEDIVWPRKSK